MTRHSAGTLDDDNLRSALKGVRDGIADRLGVKDNDPRVEWRYDQAKAKRGEYAVHVAIDELSNMLAALTWVESIGPITYKGTP